MVERRGEDHTGEPAVVRHHRGAGVARRHGTVAHGSSELQRRAHASAPGPRRAHMSNDRAPNVNGQRSRTTSTKPDDSYMLAVDGAGDIRRGRGGLRPGKTP